MFIREEVLAHIKQVANEYGNHLSPLVDDLRLADSGIDFLCLAVIYARIEDRLGRDPLTNEGAPFPVTLGDFIKLWERAPIESSTAR
jgi:hypothetical protein